MGYIHDVSMSQYVEPNKIYYSTGTWTQVTLAYVFSMDRTAADASFWLMVPAPIPSNAVASRGSYLKSFELMYSIATAACDDVASVVLYKYAFSATGSINVATEITGVTLDAAHNTAAERLAIDEHRMVMTLDTPVWIDTDETYQMHAIFDCAAGTVFKCFGALVNYTLRL